MSVQLDEIRKQAAQAAEEVCTAGKLEAGDLFVVGGIYGVLQEKGVLLAAQCCEHLNRALVVERKAMKQYGLEQVNAIPQPNHAGGAFGTVAYQHFKDPVLVESLQQKALAGMDIGATLIGMHIHPVVVPLRISLSKIGNAVLICARNRPKYVGGQRAIYDENLL